MFKILAITQIISCIHALRMSPVNFNSKLFATTVAGEQTKSGIGWDSHKAIDDIPASLVKTIEGNESMRRKFEELCRTAQVITLQI
jgi:hypothetical protein